jgi:hypothetical protein
MPVSQGQRDAPHDDINIVTLANGWTAPYNLVPQLFPIALRP